ncbi:hypothetical protein [Paenibacillus lemnae]|uniref:Uncharacterized protein n=1 Tax=Paenibacillus lemnae TaxID=1330551 RepID=A0A848M5Q3_PAELE|nr:hypothetical protein [Paenibacillus lemnae]NMO95143.1 hypothetical protein [Paenibacillus lemnae]
MNDWFSVEYLITEQQTELEKKASEAWKYSRKRHDTRWSAEVTGLWRALWEIWPRKRKSKVGGV